MLSPFLPRMPVSDSLVSVIPSRGSSNSWGDSVSPLDGGRRGGRGGRRPAGGAQLSACSLALRALILTMNNEHTSLWTPGSPRGTSPLRLCRTRQTPQPQVGRGRSVVSSCFSPSSTIHRDRMLPRHNEDKVDVTVVCVWNLCCWSALKCTNRGDGLSRF